MVYQYAEVKLAIYINSLGELEPARFSDLAQVLVFVAILAALTHDIGLCEA
jgi:hypothetical protein